MSEFVVRSNSSATALNEAVALDLLAASGLSAQRAAYIALSVNDSAPALRLIVENPGDEWVDRVFNADGKLYKAEATGDYTLPGNRPRGIRRGVRPGGRRQGPDSADGVPAVRQRLQRRRLRRGSG
ncbi:MAG: hypothetical protein IPF40_14835 [Actinomycetales bacterium]|uniref:Uncharacterized protein n=1 Tax=Candidatus Phosphoribacter hodrii TaxID=2953743 RepID=A0A934X8L0_9MICO|nr:hypothetical protein [Candidatus Phosphoribacter hodrii]